MENSNNIKKEVYEKDGYFYLQLGKIRDWSEYRVWVKREFLIKEENIHYVYFPIIKASLVKGKRDWVIKNGENIVIYIYQKCYYRGGVKVNFLSPVENVVEAAIYESPAGSLGVSYEALVEVKQLPFEYETHLSGRSYGAPRYFKYRIDYDGIKVIHDDVKLLDE